jgi:23S rRNA (uracil1939-C5)-methyltransferase
VAGEGNHREVLIRSLGAGGVGVGELEEGKVVFVPGTVSGDRVRVRVVQERRRWARGVVTELLQEGEDRVVPPCPHYQTCDGCSLQHLAYEAQIGAKGAIVGDALRRIGGLSIQDPEVHPSPRQVRDRNKISTILRRLPGGRVVAGFRQRESRSRILDVGAECLLPEEGLAKLWEDLRRGWGPGAAYLPRGRELRLELRGVGERGSLLVQGGVGKGDPERLLEQVPALASIWRRDADGGTRLLAGESFLEILWLGQGLRLRGGAFLQVNRPVGEDLHRHVLMLAGEVSGKRVIEGYSGAGLLGRELARRGGEVVAIEADEWGVEEARRESPSSFQAVRGRVEDLLQAHLPADLLLLNPPRGGLDPRIPSLLEDGAVPRIIYVSCDPGTLARDLRRIGDRYEMEEVSSFDLFPQTAHIETVVSMRVKGE